jgi:asparagine synthase (glutamine-hydrolysing)
MSGIAGIYSRTPGPVLAQDLERMIATLTHRGPDGAGAWTQGPVGLGNRLLHTTPESLHEKLPWLENGFCITADARVDNREELASQLGYVPAELSAISDSRLILAAYQRWGQDCPQKILGDFAFTIWDSHQQLLFCARDALGVKPFYYALSQDRFLFGSEIKAVLSHPAVSHQVDDRRIAEFLMPPDEWVDKETTFYAGVRRLAPAHCLIITPTRDILTQYWALDLERAIQFQNDAGYAQALREEFTKAVGRRLRSAFPLGSTLSGGIDSSSIACSARDQLKAQGRSQLHTFSAIFADAPGADESEYIDAVVAQGEIIPHALHPDRGSPLVDLDRLLQHLDEPFDAMNYFMPWEIYQAAQENGVRVLMDGTDGDTTLSHGMDYLDILARNRDWGQLACEARAITANFNHPRYATVSGIFYSFGIPHMTAAARQGRWRAFAQDVRENSQLFEFPPRQLVMDAGIKPLCPQPIRRAWRSLRGRQPPVIPSAISSEFSTKLKKQGFFQPEKPSWVPERQNGRAIHYHQFQLGLLPDSLELIDRMAAAFAVEVRFPFCDRNLVEFCLALPPEQKLQQGWSRYAMRHAMNGILPPEVQWRGGKISLFNVYPHMLRHYALDYVRDILAHPPDRLKYYLNLAVINEMFRCFVKEKNTDELEWVWQTVVLAVWLKQND